MRPLLIAIPLLLFGCKKSNKGIWNPDEQLLVWHDKTRKATCYLYKSGGSISCIADSLLDPVGVLGQELPHP